jgi:microcystin degradation protein MlrC
VVIADVWDNPGGGTAGDATVLLAELLAPGAKDTAIGTIWDPMAVQICMAAGEGAEIRLRFGAKSAPGTGNPVDGVVKVVKLVRNAEMRFGESYAPFGDAAHIVNLTASTSSSTPPGRRASTRAFSRRWASTRHRRRSWSSSRPITSTHPSR